jgi:hypothetical protein
MSHEKDAANNRIGKTGGGIGSGKLAFEKAGSVIIITADISTGTAFLIFVDCRKSSSVLDNDVE